MIWLSASGLKGRVLITAVRRDPRPTSPPGTVAAGAVQRLVNELGTSAVSKVRRERKRSPLGRFLTRRALGSGWDVTSPSLELPDTRLPLEAGSRR